MATEFPKEAFDARQRAADLAANVQRGAHDRLEQVRDQYGRISEQARDQYGRISERAADGLTTARTYAVGGIQDRPVTSVLAVLGVGVVLGVLLGLAAQRHYD